MMNGARKEKIIGRLRILLFAIVALSIMPLFSGCSFVRSIFTETNLEFTRKSLTLQVGETFNLAEIIESDDGSYTLSSSDTRVASVRNSTRILTAKAEGNADIRAEAGAASTTLRLTVTERQPDSLSISTVGELIQSVGGTSAVTFVPTATGAAARADIAWYVNGSFVNLLPYSASFEYTPKGAGEYIISAVCGDYSAQATVRVYGAASVSVEHSGALTQTTMPYSTVDFTVTVTGGDDNPRSYIVWRVDGETAAEGYGLTFSYMPTAGSHTVSAEVNGKIEYSATVVCHGSVTPAAPHIEFDNSYPHVYVAYEVSGYAQVEIATPSGEQFVCAETDPEYAERFSDAGFDARGLIELCAAGDSRRSYRIRVKSLGDGQVLAESAYSPYFTFTQLSSNASKYISTVVPGGDLYVTSDEEYVALAEYYVFFRPKTGSSSRVSFDCYIAYDRAYNPTQLWEEAFPLAATSGMYTGMSATDRGGNVMRTVFTVNTINAPTRQASEGVLNGYYAEQLHAVIPHINYDSSEYRDGSYEFPIDRAENTVSVTYTDELFYAVQSGVRPLPVAGSAADTVYEMARDIMRKICTDDMTDAQKAHAIYDWIMWKVTYDTPATGVSSGGESLSAYYLEGVFGDGVTRINGVAYDGNAVCDGMSKAYSLMCGIEGIPCVRVIGRAGSSVSESGGHAWNKVMLDGQWYVVDCTWGDSQGSLSLDGSTRKNYELGLHDHLFVTDADVYDTHFEPYRTGDTKIRYAPQTASVRYDVYSENEIFGTKINCLISRGEDQKSRLREAASAFARTYTKVDYISIPGGMNGGAYEINYAGMEVFAEDGLTLSDSEIRSVVQSAIRSVHITATVKIVTLDDVVLILMKN